MTMASAVISTGRKRVLPASRAASSAEMPSSRRIRANVTTRIELAVATPTLMMAPISDGMLSVVWDTNSATMMPMSAPGSAVMMMKGSLQDWKLITISA